jgi:DedD protein
MDKEMKKLLLVAVSVGFFLLVTITAAIIILTPKTKETPVSSIVPISNGRAQITQPDNSSAGLINQQPVIIETQELNTNSNNSAGNVFDRRDDAKANPIRPTIIVQEVAAQTVEIQKKTEPTAAAAVTPAKTPEPAPAAKPQTTPNNSTTTARPAAPVRPAAPARTINDFWVQTGAFSAQVRAEDARELLSDRGITSIIENREINGKIWYRVRLGPYTSEKEAKHWLDIVKLIDEFSNSEIRQTVRSN